MSKPFTRSFRVRFAEVDPSGHVNPSHYLRYLVETAYDWGTRYGLGQTESEAMRLVWVIRETYFEFLQSLRHDDIFEFSIWMVAWRRVRGTRSFELRRRQGFGELLAQGGQQIVCLDDETLRPMTPLEGLIDPFRIDNPREVPIPPFPKNIPTSPAAERASVEVGWRDRDMDDQVNNAVYADYAREVQVASLAEARWPPDRLCREELALVEKTFHIRYLAMGTWGARLVRVAFMRGFDDSGGEPYVAVEREEDDMRMMETLSEWQLVSPASGALVPLPAPMRESLAKQVILLLGQRLVIRCSISGKLKSRNT